MALIQCVECNNEISDKASACPKCGAPLSHSKIEEQRASVTQSHVYQEIFSGPFMSQILIVAIVAGVYKESWPVFGETFLGLVIVLMIPVIGKIVSLALAGAFGAIGYVVGNEWGGQEAGYVAGGLFFLASLGISLVGIDHMHDITRK